MEVRFCASLKGEEAMAINGVGSGYVYQDSARRRTMTASGNNFYERLSAAAEQTAEVDQEKVMGHAAIPNCLLSTEEMMQKIREKMNEIYEKVMKGEMEASFQIGASSFTLKEWEKFIEKFDESEEELEKLIKEAREMQKKAAAAKETESHI